MILQRGGRPLHVGLPLIGRQAVPLVERNADHPPASRREETPLEPRSPVRLEAPLEPRSPVRLAHAPVVGQEEVRGAIHLNADA